MDMARFRHLKDHIEKQQESVMGTAVQPNIFFARLQGLTLLDAEARRNPASNTYCGPLSQIQHWLKMETRNARPIDEHLETAKVPPSISSLPSTISTQSVLHRLQKHLKCTNTNRPHSENAPLPDFELASRRERQGNAGVQRVNQARTRFRPPEQQREQQQWRRPGRGNEGGYTNKDEEMGEQKNFGGFSSARDEMLLKEKLKRRSANYGTASGRSTSNENASKKTLGLKRRAGFQPPRPIGSTDNGGGRTGRNVRKRRDGGWGSGTSGAVRAAASASAPGSNGDGFDGAEEELHPRLKCLDPALVEQIENEILVTGKQVQWNDIAGLEFAKRTCQEIVVMPILYPDMFQGLRQLPKGLLLFGPPGTGKTMIGKAIASQTGATFFSISASSLTSKWIGQGEKLVRALFGVAAAKQPSVIFIDEIDSLLSQRSSEENEASRRIKTEFLVQLDGAGCDGDEKILVLGATNRPQELDEAARRRFMKRLYIPLPNKTARKALLSRLLTQNSNTLAEEDYDELVRLTKGYSGSDLDGLCREAAMAPLRDAMKGKDVLNGDQLYVKPSDLRDIAKQDLLDALRQVRASVGKNELTEYLKWNEEFGSFAILEED